jgi:hypothetical protein
VRSAPSQGRHARRHDDSGKPNLSCLSCRRASRCADRRGRRVGYRQRLAVAEPDARHPLRHPRGAGHVRRHLGDPPLSRHPLRQRPAHLRLQLQAVDRPADRHRRRDQGLYGRDHRRSRHRRPHPVSPQGRICRLVSRRSALDSHYQAPGYRRDTALYGWLPLDVPGLLPA